MNAAISPGSFPKPLRRSASALPVLPALALVTPSEAVFDELVRDSVPLLLRLFFDSRLCSFRLASFRFLVRLGRFLRWGLRSSSLKSVRTRATARIARAVVPRERMLSSSARSGLNFHMLAPSVSRRLLVIGFPIAVRLVPVFWQISPVGQRNAFPAAPSRRGGGLWLLNSYLCPLSLSCCRPSVICMEPDRTLLSCHIRRSCVQSCLLRVLQQSAKPFDLGDIGEQCGWQRHPLVPPEEDFSRFITLCDTGHIQPGAAIPLRAA